MNGWVAWSCHTLQVVALIHQLQEKTVEGVAQHNAWACRSMTRRGVRDTRAREGSRIAVKLAISNQNDRSEKRQKGVSKDAFLNEPRAHRGC